MSRAGFRIAGLLQRSLFAAQKQTLAIASASQATPYQYVAGWASRCISYSAPTMSKALAAALQQEISHESKEYTKPDVVASGPPSPFKLKVHLLNMQPHATCN